MFFNESKRKKLLAKYSEQTPDDRAILRILSIVFTPVSFPVLMKAMGTLKQPAFVKALPNLPKDLSSTQVFASLERLVREGLAVQGAISPKTQLFFCHRLLAEPLTREALSFGEFVPIFNVITQIADIVRDRNTYFLSEYSNREAYMRDLRAGLYAGDQRYFNNIYRSHSFRSDQQMHALTHAGIPSFSEPLLEILCNPLDDGLLLNLTGDIRNTCFELLWRLGWAHSVLRPELGRLLADMHKKDPANVPIATYLMDSLLDEERVAEAQELFATPTLADTPESWAALGVVAAMRGDNATALELFEDGLKRLRKVSGKKKVCFTSWYSVLYPLLLLHFDPTGNAGKVRNYVTATITSERRHFTNTIFMMMDAFTDPNGQRDDVLSLPFVQDFEAKNRPPAVLLCFFLLGTWADPKGMAPHVGMGVDACLWARRLGLHLIAREMASVLRQLDPEAAKPLADIPEPDHPFRNLLRYKPAWESSLENLVMLTAGKGGDGSGKTGDKRIIWRLVWNTPSEGRQGGIEHIEVMPFRQTLGAKGWSTGQSVAISKFAQNPQGETAATDQDRVIIGTMHMERSYYYGTSWTYDISKIMLALEGHPLLFRGASGERVEVTIEEPKVSALESDSKYVVALDPCPEDLDQKSAVIIREETRNCLRVYRFGESHMRIARVLGRNGLHVPVEGKENLLRALGGLASFVTVHSDVAGVESGAEKIEPDMRLYAQLQPIEDGLDLEVRTRPLGNASVSCIPGEGGENIFGTVEGRRVRTRRNLPAEQRSLEEMVEKCPALASAEQQETNRWWLSSPDLCLDLLLQFQELDQERTIVEWPKGGERKISQITPSKLKMRIGTTQGWFSVSGEIEVDDGLVMSMQELVSKAGSGGKFVQLGAGRFLALTESFKRRVEAIAALGTEHGDDIRLPPLAAALLPNLGDDVDSLEECEEWRNAVSKFDEAETLQPDIPTTFTGDLREYQAEGFTWMTRRAHCGCGVCLADDMGLGKTIQALTLLLARGADGPALVIAPTSVCNNWMDEAARFAGALNFHEMRMGDRESIVKDLKPMDVLVTSYGLLVSEEKLLAEVQWNTIILDEAQAIKNMETKRSSAAMHLKGNFRMVTTGTPIENNLGELWNLFRFINPGYLGSLEKFNKRFAQPIERDNDKNARRSLKRLISPFILRRTKGQVLTELPAKTESVRNVDLYEGERATYEAIRQNAIASIEAADGDVRMLILAQLVKLRRACCNSALVLDEEEARPSAKMDAFAEIIEELRDGGHKALVFSQFVGHLTFLRKKLEEMGIVYQYLDGSSTQAQRAASVSAFQAGKGDCFLISLKAGGTGLNLTAADYVIHMDPWWNPAVEEQASDRTHRIGQSRPVTIYRIVARDTVEEKIVKLHAWKRDLAESLLDESGAPAKLSSEDMLKLIKGEDI
ncbi:MAG: DEAD/DEAH box helicase [Desulfovibrio sp.]|jgi:hypothetical protein|nr:DEAD/DEAH box helicase [Desulfovibrio sp.]